MKSLIITLGLILGVLACGAILYFFNKSNSNNVGDNEIQKYINDSENIQLVIPGSVNAVLNSIKGDARMLGSASFAASSDLFYDNLHKKYFLLQFINSKIKGDVSKDYDMEFSIFINSIKQGESITATVSKTELADASYGTKQKPIPVFKFSRDGNVNYKTFESTTDDAAEISHIRKSYPIDVGIYLTFVKSKADFEKMF